MVGGDPESQVIPDTPQFKALDDYPRITDSLTSEFYDGVGSDLTSAYADRVERYSRRIVFVKPYYFVVFDDLKTRGDAAQFDFLLHLPNRASIKTDGSTAIYNAAKASLGVRWFSPDNANLSVKDGRIPYHIFSARTPAETPLQPAYLDLKTARPSNETQFLTAVVPAETSGEASELIGKMFSITGENLKGIRVERGNETDLVMFRTGAGSALMRNAEWSANASVLAVTNNGSNLQRLAAQNARSVTHGKGLMFSAETPASIAANYGADQIGAVINSKTATRIVLFVGTKPISVFLDGKILGASSFSFSPDDGTVSLCIPAGQHEIRMVLK